MTPQKAATTTNFRTLELPSLAGPFDQQALEELAGALPSYVASSRWYRSKSRDIESISIRDVVRVPDSNAFLFVIELEHADGAGDQYVLPLVLSERRADRAEEIAQVRAADGSEGAVLNALEDAAFRTALLEAVACETNFPGQRGAVQASRTAALSERCGDAGLSQIESFVSRAEQSNTSIIYRGKYILKLFRKLEPGTNPDLEIGRFLTERGYRNTPKVLGSLEYRVDSRDSSLLGILQEFVANQGDAWKYTLGTLEDFFSRALASGREPPRAPAGHLLDLADREPDREIQAFAGPYLRSAELLGRRTAEMHAALTDEHADSDFAPEPFTAADASNLYEDSSAQAAIAFDLLKKKLSSLGSETAEKARELLKREQRIQELFWNLRERSFNTVQIRHHGDYHLGQVLYTGDDFAIIDFEGEPARPLQERRAKALALRDVAGMVRSFQYAAYAALFGQVSGVPVDPASKKAVEAWAQSWNAAVSGAYLRGYFNEAGSAPFVPQDAGERRMLVDAFLLQKALYEVAYELNNRPDWLLIPLRGILSLVP